MALPRAELVAGLVEVVRTNLILLAPEVPTAQVAAAALALEGEDGVTELLKLVTYDDFLVRGKVAVALSLPGPSIQWAVPALIRAHDREPYEYVQRRITAALGQIGGPEAISKLEDLAWAAQGAGRWDRAEEIMAALQRAKGTGASAGHPENEKEVTGASVTATLRPPSIQRETGDCEDDEGEREDDEQVDPWRHISSTDLAEAIDRALIRDFDVTPSGRMLRPIPDLSFSAVLRGVLPWKRNPQERVDEWLFDHGIEDTFFGLADTAPKRVVYCCVLSSMVSGCWGVYEFQLGARGYLYFSDDDDQRGIVLAAWEPVDDAATRRACILAVYAREWDERGLPPAMGEWATGDQSLLQEAILRVLEAEPDAWEFVLGRLAQAPEPREASDQTVHEVAQLSGATGQRVEDVLGLVAARAEELERRLLTRSSSEDERAIVVALLVYCIAKDPFGYMENDSQ